MFVATMIVVENTVVNGEAQNDVSAPGCAEVSVVAGAYAFSPRVARILRAQPLSPLSPCRIAFPERSGVAAVTNDNSTTEGVAVAVTPDGVELLWAEIAA